LGNEARQSLSISGCIGLLQRDLDSAIARVTRVILDARVAVSHTEGADPVRIIDAL